MARSEEGPFVTLLERVAELGGVELDLPERSMARTADVAPR
jgi:hypothetical protein